MASILIIGKTDFYLIFQTLDNGLLVTWKWSYRTMLGLLQQQLRDRTWKCRCRMPRFGGLSAHRSSSVIMMSKDVDNI